MDMSGINIRLSSFGRLVTSPVTGETTTVTCREGDLEFDTYQEETAAWREKVAGLSFRQENGLPKNFFTMGVDSTALGGFQYAVQINEAFDAYYQGALDEKALKKTVSDVVGTIRSAYIKEGYDPEEFMPQLLEDTYKIARLGNIQGAGTASWHDGCALATAQNGHDRDTRDWIYYDSDYYYQSEAMKGKLVEMTQRIAARYEVDVSQLDLPTEYEDGDLRKSIYSSYSTYINFQARDQRHIGNIIDETMPPPQGLRFFYKDNETGTNKWVSNLPAPQEEPEAFFDGVLQVWYGDWSFTGRVPVRQNPSQFPISVNMFDAVSKGSTSPIPAEITDYLRNVDFFTVTVSQHYNKSHPRIY